ncbi:DUF397 domain-containing protein [Streptosporangium sp. KLBMP 9127]|nr:DUF397 domain-containing protein [Streptosporangium sp. KLBMP 9127]
MAAEHPAPHLELAWRAASRCNGANCVEVAELPHGGMAIRDSKAKFGPTIEFTTSEWRMWIADIKTGEFDRAPSF